MKCSQHNHALYINNIKDSRFSNLCKCSPDWPLANAESQYHYHVLKTSRVSHK